MPGTRVRGVVVGVLVVCAVGALPAIASADLPRTYQVTRVDSPNPVIDGRFGAQLVNVGDVNGDDRDDLLVGTDKHGAQQGTGQVVVLNGADPAGTPLRVYTQPDLDADANGTSDRRAGFGNQIARLADLDGDGVDEHVIASSGIDVDANGDDLGVVYVFDGASGALLKRLQMPAGDRTEQATGVVGDPANDPRYGRTLLNPTGLAPCDRNDIPGAPPTDVPFGGPGIGDCPNPLPPGAVVEGDVTGDGVGDVLVGATDYSETKGTANPTSDCATQPGTFACTGSGRVYLYSGADITGDPATPLSTPAATIKNPVSQPDDPTPVSAFSNDEAFGIQIIPLGDSGQCTTAPGAGAFCPGANVSNTTDSVPDFVIVANAVDDFGFSDVGESFQFDGDTQSVIKDTEYPEPRIDSSWGIAQNGVAYPPAGDLAGSTTPDYYLSDIQYNGAKQAQGRGMVINGQPSLNGSFREFPSRLIDPTPQNSEQFGLSAAGLGTVQGDLRGELAVGAIGPNNPGTNGVVVNDVHLFDPITELALQSLSAPDAQGGEAFGISVQPMGDLNGDGFLDLAVGAAFYDLTQTAGPCTTPCGNAGRVYFFLSDNSPAPVEPPAEPPAEEVVRAGRALEIEASKDAVRKGKRVTILGLLESFANQDACEGGQVVDLQRRRPGGLGYSTVAQPTVDADGSFSERFKVRKKFVYRAKVAETDACLGAVSNPEKVEVKKKKKSGR